MKRVDFDALDVAWEAKPEELLFLDEALSLLEKEDEVAAKLVSLRFFAGMPNVEAAKMLGLSESTAKRTWTYSRAFLHREMTQS